MYKIKEVFKSGQTMNSFLIKTKRETIMGTKNSIYWISCKYGESNVDDTKRLFQIRLSERQKLTNGAL